MATDFGKLNFAVSLNPQTAFPLDARSYFESLDAAKAAAAKAAEAGSFTSIYYYGQTVVVVEGGMATPYIIQPGGSLTALAEDNGEAVRVAIDENVFKYDDNGKLTISCLTDAKEGQVLAIGAGGKLTVIDITNSYSKDEVDKKISDAIASVDHLSRVIVDNLEEIDLSAEDADKYIYMVPTGLSEDDDKYNEYMVIDGALEKVGDWAVDLSNYATKSEVTAINDALKQKVDVKEGYSLVSDKEISKLATVAENAQENYVKSVSEQLSVDGTGKLSIGNVTMDQVSGLADKLGGLVEKEDGSTLLSATQAKKLDAIEIVEDKAVIKAETITDLASWLNEHAADTAGLSENNYDTEAREKLEALLAIKSVNTNQLEVSAEGQLSVKAIDKGIVTGLTDWMTAQENSANELTTKLDTFVNKTYADDKSSIEGRLDDLEDAMTWKTL